MTYPPNPPPPPHGGFLIPSPPYDANDPSIVAPVFRRPLEPGDEYRDWRTGVICKVPTPGQAAAERTQLARRHVDGCESSIDALEQMVREHPAQLEAAAEAVKAAEAEVAAAGDNFERRAIAEHRLVDVRLSFERCRVAVDALRADLLDQRRQLKDALSELSAAQRAQRFVPATTSIAAAANGPRMVALEDVK